MEEGAGEATINPDGSSSYSQQDTVPTHDQRVPLSSDLPPTIEPAFDDGGGGGGGSGFGGGDESIPNFDDEIPDGAEKAPGGIDPAIYLVVAFLVALGIYWFFFLRKKNDDDEGNDDFFASTSNDKVRFLSNEGIDLPRRAFDAVYRCSRGVTLTCYFTSFRFLRQFEKLQKLPNEVEEYYKTRAKVEGMGWKPAAGPPPPEAAHNPQHPHRIIASALMKRAMADLDSVMTLQKESAGMSKLYARSMCSVSQWKSFQLAEAVVSQEIADVKAEADDIEPGWSRSIWQQAHQYQAMLKKKHEMEMQAAQDKAKKAQEASGKASASGAAASNNSKGATAAGPPPPVKDDDPKARELAAQRAAEELLREEEKEKSKRGGGSKAFSGGGVKKGFLEGGKGGKKK
jgi:hypothetical protein